MLAVLTADLGLLLPARERLDLLAACTLSGEGKSSARMCSPQGDHSHFSCSPLPGQACGLPAPGECKCDKTLPNLCAEQVSTPVATIIIVTIKISLS